MQSFLEEQNLDQSLTFTSKNLDNFGLDIEIPSTNHPKTDVSCPDIQSERSIRRRIAHQMSDILSPARNYSLNMKTRMKVNFAWRNRRLPLRKLVRPLILAPGNWKLTLSVLVPAQCITHKEPHPTTERKWKIIPAYSSYK